MANVEGSKLLYNLSRHTDEEEFWLHIALRLLMTTGDGQKVSGLGPRLLHRHHTPESSGIAVIFHGEFKIKLMLTNSQ